MTETQTQQVPPAADRSGADADRVALARSAVARIRAGAPSPIL
ncbi:hypothetical protein [Rhodococcus sp. OK519]